MMHISEHGNAVRAREEPQWLRRWGAPAGGELRAARACMAEWALPIPPGGKFPASPTQETATGGER